MPDLTTLQILTQLLQQGAQQAAPLAAQGTQAALSGLLTPGKQGIGALEGLFTTLESQMPQRLNPAQQQMSQTASALIKPFMAKAAKKALDKKYDKDADEMLMQPGGEIILAQAASEEETVSSQQPSGTGVGQQMGQGMGQPNQGSTTNQNVIPTILPAKGFFGGASIDQSGNLTKEGKGNQLLRMLVGISGPSANQVLSRTAALQKLTGQEPLQKGKTEKLKQEYDLKLRNALLTADDPKTAGISVMNSDINNLIQARADVTLRGRVVGPIGAVGGFLGFERGERAAFESFGTQLAFSYGEHVIGQKGRAFTDNERKEIAKKITAASLNKNDSEFIGKMNAIIKQVNSRIPEGSPKMPLITEKKVGNIRRGGQKTQQSISEFSNLSDKELNRKIAELEGRQ